AGAEPGRFAGEGAALPGWAGFFALGGVALTGIDLPAHLALVARFGLQASHLAVGFVLAALALLLVQKRLWLAAHVAGTGSPGEALAQHYGSVTLRVVMLTLAALFALPYAATILGGTATRLVEVAGGAVPRSVAVWLLAFGLFLPAVIGGWRATVLITAVEALLLAVVFAAVAGVAHRVAGPGFPEAALPVAADVLADRIPGVVQYSAGLGKEVAQGGPFTTLAIISGALALVGLVLSPGVLYLGMTLRAGRGLAFGTVWVLAGLVAGLLLVLGPVLAGALAQGPAALMDRLAGVELFAGAGLGLLLVGAGMLATGFLVTSGTLLIVRELVVPFVLPGVSARAGRLTARVALAMAFALMAALASFSPLSAAVFGSLALPLSVQLFPALLGLAFVRWISRSAVLTGLILGCLMVFFTEPPGLILFEGLFLDLPWGRWPLTIHSAGWGLALNLGAVLLVSIFTRAGAERLHRDRLHDEFAARWRTDFGGRGARGAIWSLSVIWAFFALGPGAILGNTFFSQPIFAGGEAVLGIPSLWVWQLLVWLLGVPLVWWLAYRVRLGMTQDDGLRPLNAGAAGRRARRAPAWIAAGLARVTER
ncbi:MAG: hypothetical protein RIT14_440, partial [Pseudomonadota bacterium]